MNLLRGFRKDVLRNAIWTAVKTSLTQQKCIRGLGGRNKRLHFRATPRPGGLGVALKCKRECSDVQGEEALLSSERVSDRGSNRIS